MCRTATAGKVAAKGNHNSVRGIMNFSIKRQAGAPRHHTGQDIDQPATEGIGLTFTGRIASWSARHRWWVIAASVLVIVLAMFVMNTVEPKLLNDDGAEGEAATGADLIEQRFDINAAPTEQLVFSNPSLTVEDPAFRSTVEGLVGDLRELPEVESVASFYDTGDTALISTNRNVLLAQVVIAGDLDDADEKIGAILDTVDSAAKEAPGFEIAIAGFTSLEHQSEEVVDEDFQKILVISLGLGLIILLLAFRAVVAAVVPLALAIGATIGALGVATLVSRVYPLVDVYTEMVLLMGLAVGIDYSLFIVSRFRTERKAGRPKLEAIAVASDTTGRAVFYAGATVVLSLAGLVVTNNPIFVSLALAAIVVVLLAIAGSLTLLPALLGVLGDNINRLRLPFIGREHQENDSGGLWGRIADKVLARPGVVAIVTAGALIALAVPVFSLNLGFNAGADAFPDAVEGKRALELLEDNFSAGLAAPALMVVDAADVNSPEVQASVARLIDRVENDEAFFGPFEATANPDGDLLYIEVPLAGNIDDETSENALKLLRSEIIPGAFSGSTAEVYVTGQTAASMDFTDWTYSVAPYVFGFVLGLAFLLLLVMFRSIVIPVKAIVLNLLSVGAAYGVLVMVFQWGWGISILGSESTGIVEAWLPLFIFTILFGLSMDYHMLLLSRIKESYDQGYSNEESVSRGIKLTAGQITSAAAIMVGVFSAFALGRNVGLQQFGVGLAVAVLIDATVVRSVLLPASMKLLGDRNWYLPSWLEWLPKVGSAEEPQPKEIIGEAFPTTSGD